MTNNGNGAASGLKVPARNNYFYGKLLDAYHFQLEQRYFNEKRWLINRLGLGTGVLCGLELALAEDGQLVIRPGVALDGIGREIIVSNPYCIENPLQPTDQHGKAVGEPVSAPGAATICLYYHECLTEPVPVLVGECSTDQSCAANRIDERFRVQVIAGAPESMISGLPAEVCAAIFPKSEQDESFNRFAVACETLVDDCTVPSPTCVVLGVVTLDEDGNVAVDPCSYRPVVYSNAELLELLFCLAGRVDACCVVRQLRYVSGDAQTAVPGATLAEPLVVEVVDGEGNPVAGETVFFRVRGGGGQIVGADKMESKANGQAAVKFELGPNPGLNTLEANLENGSHTLFHALGVAEDGGEVDLPPVVETVWPPNAYSFNREPQDEVEKRWLELWIESPGVKKSQLT